MHRTKLAALFLAAGMLLSASGCSGYGEEPEHASGTKISLRPVTKSAEANPDGYDPAIADIPETISEAESTEAESAAVTTGTAAQSESIPECLQPLAAEYEKTGDTSTFRYYGENGTVSGFAVKYKDYLCGMNTMNECIWAVDVNGTCTMKRNIPSRYAAAYACGRFYVVTGEKGNVIERVEPDGTVTVSQEFAELEDIDIELITETGYLYVGTVRGDASWLISPDFQTCRKVDERLTTDTVDEYGTVQQEKTIVPNLPPAIAYGDSLYTSDLQYRLDCETMKWSRFCKNKAVQNDEENHFIQTVGRYAVSSNYIYDLETNAILTACNFPTLRGEPNYYEQRLDSSYTEPVHTVHYLGGNCFAKYYGDIDSSSLWLMRLESAEEKAEIIRTFSEKNGGLLPISAEQFVRIDAESFVHLCRFDKEDAIEWLSVNDARAMNAFEEEEDAPTDDIGEDDAVGADEASADDFGG